MRKGQAAMEFLMTYGWAILVVLAAIGALAYFNVLSPDRILPDKCVANPPFACAEYKVNTTHVYVSLQNGAGNDITLGGVMLSCDGGVTKANTTSGGAGFVAAGNAGPLLWAEDDLPAGCIDLASGGKFKGTFDVKYTKSGETVSHTGTGNIQARVEA